jgi:hypothetical protein
LADLRRQRPRARTLISVAIAVAAHALLFLILVVGIRVERAPNDQPAIEVSLVKLFTPHPKPVRVVKPAERSVVAQAQLVARPAPSPPLPPPVALPENGPIDPRIAAAEALRGALQATVRCAHPDVFNISSFEKEACAQHVHDLRAGAPTYTIGPRRDLLTASHGMAVVNHLSPRPGTDLGPLDMGPVRGVSH